MFKIEWKTIHRDEGKTHQPTKSQCCLCSYLIRLTACMTLNVEIHTGLCYKENLLILLLLQSLFQRLPPWDQIKTVVATCIRLCLEGLNWVQRFGPVRCK